ncbi:tRNA pseudouridine(55) synthase TruB [Aeromicrobium camelliae]|uniref:tRNA pseudouridine synthase B n=1 Tax=Aeromicrobium camelliae TaxID=1538144 RepID=A0A3N6YDA8_9ACTN|nr:tRNA pseudouridine(55) synthase TruB [Aeromicrobium camelliae]RQN07794.1 tRNA pseudouridine(55) synthase TruB [Aeromicrobium camelliae]
MTTTAGIVVVDKPAGWTSHDVVGRMRRLAQTRKVGHAGTLDPMATGVLLLGIGRATRLLGHLQLADKEYLATIRLGESTVTDDAEGEVTASNDASGLRREQIVQAMRPLTGDIEQVPSKVSAIKINGQRSYARVRAGEDVELPARPVHVGVFDATDVRPGERTVDVDVRVVCSSGTYVRALARDLGSALGVGGHLTMLRRTRVGGFTLAEAHTLEDLERRLDVVDIDGVAARSFPVHRLDDAQARLVSHGRVLPDTTLPTAGTVAMLDPSGRFLALYEQRGSAARPVAVFV